MSILDKASLIQIPSGYKNGKLYSVKPNPTYGSELVTNGDFATDSDWNKLNGSTISGGVGNMIAGGNVEAGTSNWSLNQDTVFQQNKKYKVTFKARQTSGSGNLQAARDYYTFIDQAITSSFVDYSFIVDSGSLNFTGNLVFGGRSSGDTFEIDNVSVKEVTNIGDFTFSRSSSATRVNSEGLIEVAKVIGTTEEVANGDFATNSDWSGSASISSGQLTKTSGGLAYQSGVVTANKYYKVVVDVESLDGATQLYFGGNQYTLSVGVQTIEAVGGTSNTFVGFNNGYSSGSGSVFNSISVKQYIENDVPRLDYSDGSCASLLLEGQRTNLLPYSDLSSGFTTTNVTLSNNQGTSPDGTSNATKALMASGTAAHRVYDAISSSLNDDNVLSVFIKEQNDISHIGLHADTNPELIVWFSGSDGSIINSQGLNAKTESFGNGWHRISVHYVADANDAGDNQFIYFSNRENTYPNVAFDGTEEILLYGIQAEKGKYPTSLIPTSGSTVTRTADVCNNAGTSATFNSTEGVLFAEIAALADDSTGRRITISDGTTNNRMAIGFDNSSNKIKYFLISSNTTQVNQEISVDDITQFNKIAFLYKENDFKLYMNGSLIASDTSGSTFSANTLNVLKFAGYSGTSQNFYGKTKQLMVFDEALSDEELSDLTGQVNLSFNNLATFYGYTIL